MPASPRQRIVYTGCLNVNLDKKNNLLSDYAVFQQMVSKNMYMRQKD